MTRRSKSYLLGLVTAAAILTCATLAAAQVPEKQGGVLPATQEAAKAA